MNNCLARDDGWIVLIYKFGIFTCIFFKLHPSFRWLFIYLFSFIYLFLLTRSISDNFNYSANRHNWGESHLSAILCRERHAWRYGGCPPDRVWLCHLPTHSFEKIKILVCLIKCLIMWNETKLEKIEMIRWALHA